MLSMTRVEAIPLASMQAGLPWDWETLPRVPRQRSTALPKAVNVRPLRAAQPAAHLGARRSSAPRPARCRPTPSTRELRRLLHEAMDAGACGWSAQRMRGRARAPISRRDFDGTPMVDRRDAQRDLLRARARCSASAAGLHPAHAGLQGRRARRRSLEEVAAGGAAGRCSSTRCIAFEHYPDIHQRQLRWLDALPRARPRRSTARASPPTPGFTFSFEDWNLFDEMPAWREATTGTRRGAAREARRSARGARRCATRSRTCSGAFEDIVVAEGFSARDAALAGLADPRRRASSSASTPSTRCSTSPSPTSSRPSSSACRRPTRRAATAR